MKAKYLLSYLDNGIELQDFHNVSESEVYSIFEDMKRSYDDIHLMELKNDEYEVIESFYFDENDYDTLQDEFLDKFYVNFDNESFSLYYAKDDETDVITLLYLDDEVENRRLKELFTLDRYYTNKLNLLREYGYFLLK